MVDGATHTVVVGIAGRRTCDHVGQVMPMSEFRFQCSGCGETFDSDEMERMLRWHRDVND